MKKPLRKIYNRIDWLLIIIGSYITIYNLLNFKLAGGHAGLMPQLGESSDIHAYGYYYATSTQILIALGVVMIIWGILLYKERRR